MSNINQSLVEKVRNGAIIKHTCKKEDNELLIKVLKACFENCGIPNGEEFKFEYYGKHINNDWDYVFAPAIGAEIIPLSSFFEENLTPEDKESISRISELLAELEKRVTNAEKHLFGFKPVCEQPDNEVEEKPYVPVEDRFIGMQPIESFKAAQTTPVTVGTTKQNEKLPCPQPATPVNGEWKIGEWAWNCDTKKTLGLITEITPTGTAFYDTQDGTTKEYFLDISRCVKPTDKEVEAHLVKIAEQRYPVGTKVNAFIGKDSNVPCYIKQHVFKYNASSDELYSEQSFGSFTVYRKGKWAEIIKEVEQKERWYPKYDDRYWFVQIAGDVIVASYPCKDTALDKKYIESGNCFKTQPEAEKLAQLIRDTLKQL